MVTASHQIGQSYNKKIPIKFKETHTWIELYRVFFPFRKMTAEVQQSRNLIMSFNLSSLNILYQFLCVDVGMDVDGCMCENDGVAVAPFLFKLLFLFLFYFLHFALLYSCEGIWRYPSCVYCSNFFNVFFFHFSMPFFAFRFYSTVSCCF